MLRKQRLMFVVVMSAAALGAAIALAPASSQRGLAQGPQPPPAALRCCDEEPIEGPRLASFLLGTAFSYQGQLKNGGTAVNGTCDFQFALYDAPTLGARVGPTRTVSSLMVTNGLFAATPDFGAGVFTGDARFLNMQVRCPAGAGLFTPLTPRQTVTPAPMALALPGLWTLQNGISPNLIGGYIGNVISPTIAGGAIGGGGASGAIHRVTADFGTIGGGYRNAVGGLGGAVGGGYTNTATGLASAIAGGYVNIAVGSYSSIGGGAVNTAGGDNSAIAGGNTNATIGNSGAIGGGHGNIAGGSNSTVGGGDTNYALGNRSVVGGGDTNTASGDYSFIGGGYQNVGAGNGSSIVGGFQNIGAGTGSSIGGGTLNTSVHNYTTVGGGFSNDATVPYATVGGGHANTASGVDATVGGGNGNTASDQDSTVGGGTGNTASGAFGTVAGGSANTVSGALGTVGGGYGNSAGGGRSFIGGGNSNSAGGQDSVVAGGANNTASGTWSMAAGGLQNTASGNFSFAAGSFANSNGQAGAFVWGDNSTFNVISATAPNQFLVRAAGGLGINTNHPVTGGLTVNGQVIAGGVNPPAGAEPLNSEGAGSGLSLDDRVGGNQRWVIYPQNGVIRFWNALNGDVATIDLAGKVTANGGFSGQCLSNASSAFNANAGKSCNMDFAEAFASAERTTPGDLVSLDTQRDSDMLDGINHAKGTPIVHKTGRAYDDLLVGVVSQNPGLVFDNGQSHLAGDNSQLISADKTVVALVGRVLVNVSLENGPIAAGDPLTSADTPGAAMKASHAGKIIGYALEDIQRDGQALVLLQPGMYLPNGELATQAENAQLKARLASLEAQQAATDVRLAALEQRSPFISPEWLVFAAAVLVGVFWRSGRRLPYRMKS